ncbi:MAG TPA: hypothetical protein VMX33_07885 [bacterium]|nr:hypothetical protein [bacterium]
MRPLRIVAACLVALVALSTVSPQTAVSPAAVPEPYTKDEFPPWATGVRRFEIVSLGVFPILLFYTRLAADLQRYAGSNFDGNFVPWPFKNENSYSPTDSEQITYVLTAAGISLAFGAVDAILLFRANLP